MIDVDSFVGAVCGRLKQGAAYGYTHVLGYHPLLATRADTREALHIRLRKGSANTQKGIVRFTDELIARVGRLDHDHQPRAAAGPAAQEGRLDASLLLAGRTALGVRHAACSGHSRRGRFPSQPDAGRGRPSGPRRRTLSWAVLLSRGVMACHWRMSVQCCVHAREAPRTCLACLEATVMLPPRRRRSARRCSATHRCHSLPAWRRRRVCNRSAKTRNAAPRGGLRRPAGL